MKKTQRSEFPDAIEIAVLTKSRRRCAFCYGFRSDMRAKMNGQIAHIDRDSANVALENAAYLCLNHHDEYDGTRKQSKRLKPEELKYFQSLLYEVVRSLPSSLSPPKTGMASRKLAVTLEVYDRRLPIYQKTRQFIRDVSENLRPDIKVVLQFNTDTDQAIFLFDDGLAAYLETLFKNALRLRMLNLLRERILTHPDEVVPEQFHARVEEETELALWFANQPEVTRARFAPFLRLV